MNFGFDDEQMLLRSEARKLLDEQCPLEDVRRIGATEVGYSEALWKQLGELGWLGLVLPEDCGGAGLGWVDFTVLLEETGRTLLPSPLISTMLAGITIAEAGTEEQRQRMVPSIADGTRIGTLGLFDVPGVYGADGITLRGEREGNGFVLSGEKPFVFEAVQADTFVVAFRTGDADTDITVAMVEADTPGLRSEARAGLDLTKRHGTLIFEGVRVDREAVLGDVGGGWPLVDRARDRGAAAVAAEAIGSSEALLAMTVQYARDRKQFGEPIGHYQGVKHPLAEAHVDIECLKSLVYYTMWALDESPEDVALSVSKAKGFASEACNTIGVTGIQIHGAIGYTEASDVHLYLRRSKWVRPAFGGEDFHYDRVATIGGL